MQKRLFKRVLGIVLSVLLVAILLVPVTGSVLAASGNMLVNGDFEAANSLDSFLTGAQTRAVISSDKGYGGSSKSLLMTPYESTTVDSSTTNYVKQQVTVEEDTNYIWSFYVNCSWGTSWDEILRFGVHGTSDFSDNLITDRETSGVTTVFSTANNNYYINRSTPVMNQNQWYRMTVAFNSEKRTTVYLGCSVYRNAKIDPNFKAYTDNWTLTKVENDASNLVVNGGFENSTYKYTFGYPGGNFSNTGTYPTSAVTHTGSYALQSTSVTDNPGAKFYQGVNVAANTDYKWTFWLKFDGTITSDAIRAGVYKTEISASLIPGAADFISTGITCSNQSTNPPVETGKYNYLISNSINQAWARYTITFNSGSSTRVYLTFINNVALTKIYTDDWSVSVAAQTSEQVLSGDFEDESSIGDFLVTKYSGAQRSSVKSHCGASSVLLTPYNVTGGNGINVDNYIKQKVTVEANKNYNWTFYVNCSWGTSYDDLLRFGVHGTANTDSIITNIAATGLETAYSATYKNYYIKKPSMTQNQWYKIVVTFNSGTNTSVYLGNYVLRDNTVDANFKAYTDDWTISSKLFVPTINADNTLAGVVKGMNAEDIAYSYSQTFLVGQTGAKIAVVDKNGNKVSISTIAMTGQKVRVTIDGSATEYGIVIAGDASGDGIVNMYDLISIKNHLLNKNPLSGAFSSAADINSDTGISLLDLLELKSIIL